MSILSAILHTVFGDVLLPPLTFYLMFLMCSIWTKFLLYTLSQLYIQKQSISWIWCDVKREKCRPVSLISWDIICTCKIWITNNELKTSPIEMINVFFFGVCQEFTVRHEQFDSFDWIFCMRWFYLAHRCFSSYSFPQDTCSFTQQSEGNVCMSK